MKKDIVNFSLKEFNKNTFFEFSILLFAFSLPLWRNINTIILLPISIAWLYHSSWKIKIDYLKQNKNSFLIILFLYLLFWIGLLLSDNITDNLRDIERGSTLFIIPLFIFSADPIYFNLKKITIALGIGLFLGIIICWFHVFVDILSKSDPAEQAKYFFQWIYSDWKLLAPLGMHPSYFAVLLVLFLSSIMLESDFSDFRKRRVLYFVTLFISFLFLLETSSRIAFISITLIFLFYIVKMSSYKKKLFYLLILVTIIAISSQFNYLTIKFDKIFDSDGNISFERIHRWRNITEVFIDSKDYIFGTGMGDVDKIYTKAYQKGNFNLALKNKYNAHNQYLEFFVSNGIVGLGTYLLILLHFVYKTKLRSPYHFNFFLIIILFSITESIFCRSKGVFFFSFFYSMLILKSSNVYEKNSQ